MALSPSAGQRLSDAYLWGVSASPYYLKMQALLDFAGVPYRCLPQEASRSEALRTLLRLQRAKRGRAVRKHPGSPSALDEYPSVPFYSLDGEQLHYDSSALAVHLDAVAAAARPLFVPQDPLTGFLCRLLDEAFDEFGLYMVHHMRWVGSARTTQMGHRTAREMRSVLPPGMTALFARSLYHRQVRRCPYLFSVAPAGFSCGVSGGRTPPSKEGFPPTHELLETAWRAYLAAMESLLARRPYLLGDHFTLADASAYGQLAMNLVDPEAAELLQSLAPETYRWLRRLEGVQHVEGGKFAEQGGLSCDDSLVPLLEIIGKTFIPVMVANAQAYTLATAAGQSRFNEDAFDRGEALYDGEILGRPYRAVIKTFQVQVWSDLQAHWLALDHPHRDTLGVYLPAASCAALSGM